MLLFCIKVMGRILNIFLYVYEKQMNKDSSISSIIFTLLHNIYGPCF